MIRDLNIFILLILGSYNCQIKPQLPATDNPEPQSTLSPPLDLISRPNPNPTPTVTPSLTITTKEIKFNVEPVNDKTTAIVPITATPTAQICSKTVLKVEYSCPTLADPNKICFVSQSTKICIDKVAKTPNLICQKQDFYLILNPALNNPAIIVPLEVCIPGTITVKVINSYNNNTNKVFSRDNQNHRILPNTSPDTTIKSTTKGKTQTITKTAHASSTPPIKSCTQLNFVLQLPCPTLSDPDQMCAQPQTIEFCQGYPIQENNLNCETQVVYFYFPPALEKYTLMQIVCVPAMLSKTITHVFNNNNNVSEQSKVRKEAIKPL